MRKKILAKLRREVRERARGFCEYCWADSDFSDSLFDVEHIVPMSQKGKTESGNLAFSCHGCNLYKSNKIQGFDVVSDRKSKLFDPRKDIWNAHFGWAENYSIIVGLTPIGRATVETLKMNRKGLVNQRKALFITGNHPPITR
jgi:hypothetical protein